MTQTITPAVRPQPEINAGLRAVLNAYTTGDEVSNDQLYEAVKTPLGFDDGAYEQRVPVGRSGAKHCVAQRAVRWHQQTLRRMNLIERVPGRRAVWRLTVRDDKKLTLATSGMTLIGFSTDLGVSLWSSCADAFARIDEPIALLLTSPPYPLAKPRKYGNPPEKEIVEFICRSLEPIIKNLLPGGSIVLNVGQDCFIAGSPARSLYPERLVLALSEMGLSLMDRLVWHNRSKAPGPMQWASLTRQQLNVSWEMCLWFTNDPHRCFADNRRVLQPHTERHKKLMARGGEARSTNSADGAYRLRAGRSFANETGGSIPRNVLTFTHQSGELNAVRRQARDLGLPSHGATMPLDLAKFLVNFMTEKGQLVADIFGGWATTAKAAEETGRRWIISELAAEYVAGQALRFTGAPGYRSSFDLVRP